MLRTVQFVCTLPSAEADALNRESARIYNDMLTRHYRLYRKQEVWLSLNNGKRIEDMTGGPTFLHAHSRDAAQEAFYKACKTAKTCKAAGLAANYPHWRKRFRTTIWKSSGIRLMGGSLLLARAKGHEPVQVPLPDHLLSLPVAAFLEVRLVWERASRHYGWHVVVEDGMLPEPPPGANTAAIDLGEIHPAALTDGRECCIITCRALRATQRYTAKRLIAIKAKQERKHYGSRSWRRLQRRKVRFQAKQKRRLRDLEHKVSRAVVQWAREHNIGTLVIGDARNAADGKRLGVQSQQQNGLWSHSR